MKPVLSALPRLTPMSVVNTGTGEVLEWEDLQKSDLSSLLNWVFSETTRLYTTDKVRVHEVANGLKFNAAEYARQAGFTADHMGLSRDVKAKSRLNKLVGYKLMSETASYERNPNPRKQPHAFNKTTNLGAVDGQMASLEREGNLLILTWKCWENEYEISFLIPHYLQTRVITKWTLPVVSEQGFIFVCEEQPEPITGSQTAGIDLGRVEPFTMAVLSKKGLLEAEYRARPQVRSTNIKRERILKEILTTRAKAETYETLGADSNVLRTEITRMRAKAKRISNSLSGEIAADITNKITRHEVKTLHIENLKWAVGAKYGSRWAHGQTAEKIEHAAARAGVGVKRVNARGTSQKCHKCQNVVAHNSKTRVATCTSCRIKLDRDVNAAMNIAKNQGTRLPIEGLPGNVRGEHGLRVLPGVLTKKVNPSGSCNIATHVANVALITTLEEKNNGRKYR